jgi:hypothetical protein
VVTLPLSYTDVLAETDPAHEGFSTIYAASDHLIVRAAFPGDVAPRVLVSGDDVEMYPYALSSGGSYLYWLNRGSVCTACKTVAPGAVMRVKKDGSERPQRVYQADTALHGLAIGSDALYVTAADGRVLKLPRPADGPLR